MRGDWQPSAAQPVGQLNPAGYAGYGLTAGLIIAVSIVLSTLGTHGRIALLRRPDRPRPSDLGTLRQRLRLLIADANYASLLACMLFFSVGAGIMTSLATYIQTYFWKLNAGHLAVLAGATGVGVILGLVTVALLVRSDKKRTTISLYCAAVVAATGPVVLGLVGAIPRDIGALMPILFLQQTLLIQCVFGAMIMGWSMIADVADHMELKTGWRMEGLIFAALVMINKAVSGVGVFLSGAILTAIDFPEKAAPADVPATTIDALALIYVSAVALMIAAAMGCLGFYGITRAAHAHTLRELGARRPNR
ncbi:MFS transporter [Sinimarinibacterium thermocellulolyticum]|uniref:MFS transporter n=1 Tax=Sinimarinibacterium thermocellulolyticum TaxID=3170016 RepID=A0ABV2A7H3_9GAMM